MSTDEPRKLTDEEVAWLGSAYLVSLARIYDLLLLDIMHTHGKEVAAEVLHMHRQGGYLYPIGSEES